ncbi:MAG: class I SAM-dependent methyltransferase [Nitrospinae bacterium]|nr:class I SAM-dependent methyltransferase [Nitrospinota bacterium]
MLKKSSVDYPRPSALTQFLIRIRQFVFPGSQNYWEKRYSLGGNSGKGSYGKSAEFKSETLNKFVRDNGIDSVTEYGCGDGNQLTYAEYSQYIGLDISEQAVKRSSALFSEDSTKNFFVYDPNDSETNQHKFAADLVLSLDVIYHLVEDEVYRNYLSNVFNSARRYVAIYSSNEEAPSMLHSKHVRHRKFASDIEEWFPAWELKNTIKNDQLQSSLKGKEPSVDFFIFQAL